ncbi:Adaptive-response+sensory-kinase+SasA [Methylocapsa aurea]|uniref:sensor histidine kinase n=1 Tax=Methylocapsa aurea TaxID=663610 RepID=UPI003D189260
MILKRSLLMRLVVFMVVAGVLMITTMPLTYIFPMVYFQLWPYNDRSLDNYAYRRVKTIIVESLRRNDDGVLFIDDTDALISLKRQSPQLRYAVKDETTGQYVSSSWKELEEIVKIRNHINIEGFAFTIDNNSAPGKRGSFTSESTQYGRVDIITYGETFSSEDVLYLIAIMAGKGGSWKYSYIIFILSVIAALTLYRGLAPLRKATAQVSSIDLKSLNTRLSTADTPAEILPLMTALNDMFARVDEGVACQKRFVANSAHELRTPIDLLRARIDRMENSEMKFELMRDARRIQTIAEQLLVIARDEARGAAASTDVVDLIDVSRAVVMDYLPISLDLGRQIEFETDCTSPAPVTASEWAVQCVVRNLVENAVRAEPDGGIVLVRVLASGTVEVVDHGQGVATEDRETIFEPFWRRSDVTPGAGLGLTITRELIGRYCGRILVADTPGGGATFRVTLPQVFEPANSKADACSEELGLEPYTGLDS